MGRMGTDRRRERGEVVQCAKYFNSFFTFAFFQSQGILRPFHFMQLFHISAGHIVLFTPRHLFSSSSLEFLEIKYKTNDQLVTSTRSSDKMS